MIEHKMSAGDMLTLCIEETNMMGSGVAKADGMVVFCDGTVAGDVAIALITEVKKSYAKAKPLKIVTPSPCRSDARCPHSTKCGGCGFSHITYEHEQFVKKCGVEASFRRCGSFKGEVKRLIPSKTEGYRNKAVFHFDENLKLGYYGGKTHAFAKIESCAIVHPVINNIMKETETLLQSEKSRFKGAFTYLYIRHMERTNSSSVVFGYKGDEDLLPVAKALEALCPSVKCVMKGKGEDPSKDSYKLVSGEEFITDEFLGMSLEMSPKAFYQVNSEAAEALCLEVSRLADLKKGQKCLDLYCGIGTIGLSVAKKNPTVEVWGVEINKKAAENAVRNAKKNSLSNAHFFSGDSAVFAEKTGIHDADCIIVDPPRAGLSNKTVKEIIGSNAEKIVYVSCNSSTMARDIKALSAHYSIKDVSAVDLFPKTLHIETVALLVRTVSTI